MFKFSARSRSHLRGVHRFLARVMKRAIKLTKIDFGIIDGLRTKAEQQALFDSGASKTLNSKHLTGKAVDIMAYIGARGSWELELYCQIADAIRDAAVIEGVSVRWGGAWHINDIRDWEGPMADALQDYIDVRRSQGRRPFIDAGHFELSGPVPSEEELEEEDEDRTP